MTTEKYTRHRLKRGSFKKAAEELAYALPEGANHRLPINLKTYAPWLKKDIPVYPDLPGDHRKTTETERLRDIALEAILTHNADITIYTDGSASGGTREGGSAAVITKGDQNKPEIIDCIKKRGCG